MNFVQSNGTDAVNRIPTGAIRLSDAFEKVYRALTPDWRGVSDRRERSYELETLNSQELAELGCDSFADDPHREEWEATGRAETIFRKALYEGELSACIYTRPMGKILELDPELWLKCGSKPGIQFDFTAPSDPTTPGPDCTWKGVRLPVFLMRKPFLAWLNAIAKISSNRDVLLSPTDPETNCSVPPCLRGAETESGASSDLLNSKDDEIAHPELCNPGTLDSAPLDPRDPDVKKFIRQLAAAQVSAYLVAYFLEHYIDRPHSGKVTSTIVGEIDRFLKGNKKVKYKSASRKTISKGYKLAMSIAQYTKSPAHWATLGVPNLKDVPK